MSRKVGQIVRGQNRRVPESKIMAIERGPNNRPTQYMVRQQKTVYVGRLSCQVEDGQYLRKLFGHCGQIRFATIVRRGECHAQVGFGFVGFHCLESVYLALKLNDTMDNASGSFLRVERYQRKNKQQRVEDGSETTKVAVQPVRNAQSTASSRFQITLKKAHAIFGKTARKPEDNASGNFQRYQNKQQRVEDGSETRRIAAQPVKNSMRNARQQIAISKFRMTLKEVRARLAETIRKTEQFAKSNNENWRINWQQMQMETKGYHRNGINNLVSENPKSEKASSSPSVMSSIVFGNTVPHAKKNDPSITIPWRPIGLKLHDPRLIIPPNLRIQTVTNNLELPAFGVSFLRNQFLGKNGRKMAVKCSMSQKILTKSVYHHSTKVTESQTNKSLMRKSILCETVPMATTKLVAQRPILKRMLVSSDSPSSSSSSSPNCSNKFVEKRPNLKRMMISSDSSSSSSSDSSSISSSSSDDECDDEDDYPGANAPKRAKFSKNGGEKTDNDDDVLFLPKTGVTVRGPPRMEFQQYFGDEDSEEEGAEEDNGPSPGAKLASEFAKMKSTRERMIKMLEIVKKSD